MWVKGATRDSVMFAIYPVIKAFNPRNKHTSRYNKEKDTRCFSQSAWFLWQMNLYLVLLVKRIWILGTHKMFLWLLLLPLWMVLVHMIRASDLVSMSMCTAKKKCWYHLWYMRVWNLFADLLVVLNIPKIICWTDENLCIFVQISLKFIS